MAVSVLALRPGCLFTPKKHISASGTHLCFGLSISQGLVRADALGKSLKVIELIVSRTRDLPACIILP
jgi:hypothetical protein